MTASRLALVCSNCSSACTSRIQCDGCWAWFCESCRSQHDCDEVRRADEYGDLKLMMSHEGARDVMVLCGIAAAVVILAFIIKGMGY